MPDTYSRKVSAEEEREGYLMVLKDRLSFFPPLRESFALEIDGTERVATVDSYRCECRGPDKPHEHYFLRLPGLRKGEQVSIIHRADDAYSVEVGAASPS